MYITRYIAECHSPPNYLSTPLSINSWLFLQPLAPPNDIKWSTHTNYGAARTPISAATLTLNSVRSHYSTITTLCMLRPRRYKKKDIFWEVIVIQSYTGKINKCEAYIFLFKIVKRKERFSSTDIPDLISNVNRKIGVLTRDSVINIFRKLYLISKKSTIIFTLWINQYQYKYHTIIRIENCKQMRKTHIKNSTAMKCEYNIGSL